MVTKAYPDGELNPKKIRDVADYLQYGSFQWSSTPQGWGYWETVIDNLLCVANKIEWPPKCEMCGQEVPNEA